jgi:trigger factor
MDFVKDFKVTKEEDSQVKIEGEIPFEMLEKHRTKAIKKYGKDMEIDGFRKGHVPDEEVVKRVGEMGILSEMAERAISEAYPEACKHHEIDAIGYPQISITKIAQDNPLGFTALVAVMPDITLGDYKAIATEENKDKASTEVTDEDIQTQIKDILRQKTAYERMQTAAATKAETEEKQEETDGVTELPTEETSEVETDEAQTHTHEDGTVHEGPAHVAEPEVKAVTDDELPELTDEYVQTLGEPGQFQTVTDFKDKIKEHLTLEKEKEVHAAHRAKITDKIVEASTMNLPRVLIDSEIEQMFGQMNEDLKRANLKMDDYLEHIKKTKEDLIKEWEPAAEKRAKLQLILNEIAKKEDTKPDQTQADAQVAQLMEQHKDADEARVRVYVESVMTNESIMKMLEEQK